MGTRRFGRYDVETSREGKIFFPDSGVTKGELIDYYVRVADVLLPLIDDRPLTLFRWPDGIGEKGFVQQEIPAHFPGWIPRVTVDKRGGGRITHPMAEKAADLALFADQGTVTLHAWLSRADRPDYPDSMVYDLDPPDAGDGAFALVRDAARDIRSLLGELGLEAFVKTSGSRGLHVTSPLRREHTFDETRSFARSAAKLLAHRNPQKYTVEQYKKDRGERLFLDTVRNSYGMTMAVAYTVRDKPGAPVAMPLGWDEVGRSAMGPRRYTIRNAFRRLAQRENPWKGMHRHARSLAGPRRRLESLMAEAGLEMVG